MSLTIEQVRKARADLEKRLRIDIDQFEKDTGTIVDSIDIRHCIEVSGQRKLMDVNVEIEVPR